MYKQDPKYSCRYATIQFWAQYPQNYYSDINCTDPAIRDIENLLEYNILPKVHVANTRTSFNINNIRNTDSDCKFSSQSYLLIDIWAFTTEYSFARA